MIGSVKIVASSTFLGMLSAGNVGLLPLLIEVIQEDGVIQELLGHGMAGHHEAHTQMMATEAGMMATEPEMTAIEAETMATEAGMILTDVQPEAEEVVEEDHMAQMMATDARMIRGLRTELHLDARMIHGLRRELHLEPEARMITRELHSEPEARRIRGLRRDLHLEEAEEVVEEEQLLVGEVNTKSGNRNSMLLRRVMVQTSTLEAA